MRRITIRALVVGTTSLLAFLASTAAAQEKPLKVVASFSIIADFAKNVGGKRIVLTTLVGPNGDAHVYEPRPADVVAVGAANVMLVNGLGFEGFLARLIEASGTKAAIATVSDGVTLLKLEEKGEHRQEGATARSSDEDDQGAVDPHAWQAIPNAEIYVTNIVTSFCKADPAGCNIYRTNGASYQAKLAALDKQVRDSAAAIPSERRTIITSHDAFGYFAHEYKINFLAPEGASTEAEASAADVAKLIDQIREENASAIFMENITDPRLSEQISRETGMKIGGSLFSDALSPIDGPAATYVDMMQSNIRTITAAISGS